MLVVYKTAEISVATFSIRSGLFLKIESLKTISVRRRGGGQTRPSALTQTESAPTGARAAAPDNFSCWRPLAERGGGGSFRRVSSDERV